MVALTTRTQVSRNSHSQLFWDRFRRVPRFKALVIESHNIERLLRHLGEPLEPPKRSPARDPPYFKSKVLRRKLGELN